MNILENIARHDKEFSARLNRIDAERERTQFYAEIGAIRERERRKDNSLYGKLYKFVSHAYNLYKGGEY